MKYNRGSTQKIMSKRCNLASLLYRHFIRAGILSCLLVLFATPMFAQMAAAGNPCKDTNADQRCGVLKGCKVAGSGVKVGTPFTFNFTDPYGSGTPTILAGPAPGGYCKVSGSLPIGTNVTINETPIPPGIAVSDITVTPASQLVSVNVSAGTVTVKIGPGVTEVTYTDHSAKSGYLEICKQGVPAPAPLTGNFTFTVNPGSIGPIVVPAGYCSPPVEVPSGAVTITETPVVGHTLTACTAFPVSAGPCTITGPWTVKVNVAPGGLSSQTIATITDK